MNERRLYVGAPVRCAGWEVYDARPHDDVDHVGPLDELREIETGTVSILYVNAINRLDSRREALRAMHAWWRAMRPGGALIVVGIDTVAVGAALAAGVSVEDQFTLMQHLTQRSAWTAELLQTYLHIAGFTGIRRTFDLNLFQDVSSLKVGDRPISLNVIGSKP